MKQKLSITKMGIKEALSWAYFELRGGEVLEPEASALVLLGDVLGMSRTELLANPEKGLSTSEVSKFKGYIARRQKHESVWHIIGYVIFWGMEFEVTNDVLVPRPETELLVQEALKGITNYELRITNKYSKNSKLNHKSELINHKSGPKVLDIGTGSGTIAIALAEEFPEIDIQAVDISKEALVVAKKNAKRNGVTNIRFTQADLFIPVAKNEPLKTKFDIITANLPYIPSEDMEGLAIDVYHYEPKLALDGGLGGLEIYKRMLSQVGKYLKPGGQIFCEIGVDQGKEFKILVKKYLPNSSVQILGDLAGIDRIAIIKTNNN